TFQLLLFATVMLGASIMMFREERPRGSKEKGSSIAWWLIALEGLAVGVLTGLVGVGGGFIIVPALVLLGGLSMHMAVGTSLAIIAMQSGTGFIKYLDVLDELGLSVNINLMLVFGLIGAAGSIIGRTIGSKISNRGLRKGFAVFLVLMGGYIIYMNV
ncbi:MAG TPA: sulfite exporter TauE/SafE family protein, partial [Fodinibius sp.]|nr:sulfite exporter TauE/SafE family protein [Fodinibius sp.]